MTTRTTTIGTLNNQKRNGTFRNGTFRKQISFALNQEEYFRIQACFGKEVTAKVLKDFILLSVRKNRGGKQQFDLADDTTSSVYKTFVKEVLKNSAKTDIKNFNFIGEFSTAEEIANWFLSTSPDFIGLPQVVLDSLDTDKVYKQILDTYLVVPLETKEKRTGMSITILLVFEHKTQQLDFLIDDSDELDETIEY